MPEACTLKPAHSYNNTIYFRPLIPLLLAFIAGITCAYLLPDKILPATGGISLSAASLIFSACRRKNALLSPLFLFFCLGYFALTPWMTRTFPDDHIRHFVNDNTQWEIFGTIDATPEFQNFRTVCILNHIRLSRLGSDAPPVWVRGKLRTIIYGKTGGLDVGDRIAFTSKLSPFTNFKNPGGFDYIKYMAFQQVWGNAYTSSQKTAIQASAGGMRKTLTFVRHRISELIHRAASGDANAILNALILGDRQQISKPLRQAFNRAGISHILAISGLHVGILATFSFFLFKWLLSRSGLFLRHAWTRKGAAILSIFPVLFYGIMAGMSPSTQRAVIMVCVFLLTFLIHREHDLINTVSIAALFILIFHPPSLFSVAFQLSFVSVLSIIYGVRRVYHLNTKSLGGAHFLMKTGATFLLVSGLAIIGTAPLTMFYFNQISLMGIFSNLIFVPLIGFIVVPLGLFSVLVFMPFSVPAAFWGLKICGIILKTAILWIYQIAELPWAAMKTVTPSHIEITLAYALFAGILYLLFPAASARGKKIDLATDLSNKEKQSSTDSQMAALKTTEKSIGHPFLNFGTVLKYRQSGRTGGILYLVIILIIISGDVSYWVQKRWGKTDLTVTVIDVGQGNAALLEMPKGQTALIDGGGYTDNTLFDVGERVLAPFLWRRKIKTIETVILTHYDADHLNGLIYILKNFNVRQVFANHDPGTCMKNKEFTEVMRQNQIRYPAYKDFTKKMEINGVTIKVLYPGENFSAPETAATWRNSNNNSMVIQVNFGKHALLFPGDIMAEGEKELVDSGVSLPSTVMVSPHHGSRNSTTENFLDHVHPESIVISSGRQNRFGFPSPIVLALYENRNIKTFRTDVHGAVTISSDGNWLTMTPFTGAGFSWN